MTAKRERKIEEEEIEVENGTNNDDVEKTNSFCFSNVLRMAQPSSLMVLQHCVRAYGRTAEFQWFYGCSRTHTHNHAYTNTHLLTSSRSTHTCHTNVFLHSPSISCAVLFISVATVMIQASGITIILCITSECEHFVRNPKQMNERTNERANRRRTLKLTIVLAYTHSYSIPSVWCHAQNLMAARF